MIKVYNTTLYPLYELKTANLTTIGKKTSIAQTLKLSKEEEKKYFKKCFLAEHSTIEILHFCIYDDSARGDVANQISHATKGLPRYAVQSSRPDWNNGEQRKPSDQTFINFRSYWNPLAFMQMARQRLCANAQAETRQWVQEVIKQMAASDEPMLSALAECCMPQCQYRGGKCYELKPCGKCPKGTEK